jgi:hypothetical protein
MFGEPTSSPDAEVSDTVFVRPVSPTASPITAVPTLSAEPTASADPSAFPTLSNAPSLSALPTTVSSDAPSAAPKEPTFAEKVLAKCGMTERNRATAIYFILASISDASDLVDEFSHSYEARLWLDVADELLVCANQPKVLIQRYVAAVAYFSLNGPEWSNCQANLPGDSFIGDCVGDESRWLSVNHECDWYGLECDNDSEIITKVNLTANDLAGVLPVELFALTELTGLSMDHNKNIGGPIPSEIGKLSKLTYLDMDDNYLDGTIPEVLYTMTTLQAIDLNANRLSGTISNKVGNLVNLMVLQLEDNILEGPVPEVGLANLDQMRTYKHMLSPLIVSFGPCTFMLTNRILVLFILYTAVLLTLQGNFMTGSLESACANVGSTRSTNPGYLQFFMTDCLDVTAVECSCCSRCF